MEAKKLKSITTLPLKLIQKESKNARKSQTLIFELESWFFACRVVFSQYEDPRTQFFDFTLKWPKNGAWHLIEKPKILKLNFATYFRLFLCSVVQIVAKNCNGRQKTKIYHYDTT